jgi:hypothetical protein
VLTTAVLWIRIYNWTWTTFSTQKKTFNNINWIILTIKDGEKVLFATVLFTVKSIKRHLTSSVRRTIYVTLEKVGSGSGSAKYSFRSTALDNNAFVRTHNMEHLGAKRNRTISWNLALWVLIGYQNHKLVFDWS